MSGQKNGAVLLVEALRAGGIDTLFANPGTTEMCLVEALDRLAGMRSAHLSRVAAVARGEV